MTLRFRNLTVTPVDPVEDWGFEGLLAAVDRGEISDWSRIVSSVRREPWGEVARMLPQALDAAEDVGVAATLRRALDRARATAASNERRDVAEQVRVLIDSSGLSRQEFAARIGTSASRLSTYATGKVSPSATLLLRMQRLGGG